MENLNIILPLTLLLIGFLLKLFIGKNIETPSLIQALCELPVDIIFLALSFAIAFTISNSVNQASGLFYCFAGIAVAILVVVLWRISISQYLKKNKYPLWVLILAVNLFIASYGIMKSVDLIIEVDTLSTEKVVEDIEQITNQNQEK